MLSNVRYETVETPYGTPSDKVTIGEFEGKTIAFLPRHGGGHNVAPHKINFRANIAALKQLGVKRILAACAVGSLHPDYKAGDMVFVDQFIDMTKGRINTFFDEEEVYHVSLAKPSCTELGSIGIDVATEMGLTHHETGNYVCIQGPRYSTQAESIFFQQALKGHVIGMTMATESALAREMEICYQPIACVTDYDAWSDHHVSAKEVREVMQANVKNVKELIFNIVKRIPAEQTDACGCWHALADAKQ
jgi:5'-methylthioadenosine phosphorylase